MDVKTRCCFYLLVLSIIAACVTGMPTVDSQDGVVDLGQLPRAGTPSRSWSGYLRGPRRASLPSRFDTQLVDLNRNPTYYNYHTLPEQVAINIGSPVSDTRLRRRRSPQNFGRRFSGIDAGFPSDDILRPPSFRDEQPRQPERTPYSDRFRSDCIDGGPSCTPKPQRKYFDFYT